MADGIINSGGVRIDFSVHDLEGIALSALNNASGYQKAITLAAKGNYDAAAHLLSTTFTQQGNDFAALAARAQASGDPAVAARFADWSQRMSAQSASFAEGGLGTAESSYSDWMRQMDQRVADTKGAFSNPLIKRLVGAAGWAGDGMEIFNGWQENGWAGAAQQTGGALASIAGAALAIALIAALPLEVPVFVAGLLAASLAWGLEWLTEKILGNILDIEGAADKINTDSSYRIVRYDPLALDLDGDGKVGTHADANWSGALFDNDGDGIRTATGWVGANDGLLVLDIDGNGRIDSGRELFGDQTVLAGGAMATGGFAALAAMDTNGDGQVDAKDADFASLRVWRDANGNGTTEAGELLSLSELGITSLSTAAEETTSAKVDGGTRAGSASYTRVAEDGTVSTGVMQEFDFDNDTLHSKYTETVAVPESLTDLANLQGMGKLRDLREASALSPALEQQVRAFSAATTRADQQELLEGVLFDWARTNPTFTDDAITVHVGGGHVDPNSTNVVRLLPNQVLVWPDDFDLDAENTRKVRVVEAILGSEPITEIWCGDTTIKQYLKVYDTFFDDSYDALTQQTRLKSYTDLIGIQWSSGDAEGLSFDFSGVVAKLEDRFAGDKANAVADLIYLIGVAPIVADNRSSPVCRRASRWKSKPSYSSRTSALSARGSAQRSRWRAFRIPATATSKARWGASRTTRSRMKSSGWCTKRG